MIMLLCTATYFTPCNLLRCWRVLLSCQRHL